MLRALQAAFVTAFSGPSVLGALVCFVVTVADVTVLNIGSAFWGLVAGLVVSGLVQAGDSREQRARRAAEVTTAG